VEYDHGSWAEDPVSPLGNSDNKESWEIEEPKVIEEPQYVDDPFGDNDNSGRKYPNWAIPKEDDQLVRFAFEATSGSQPRKYFPTKRSRSRWNNIIRTCCPLRDGESKYPQEWVESCIEWARKTNVRYLRSKPMAQGMKITFDALLSAIENESRCMDFVSKLENAPMFT